MDQRSKSILAKLLAQEKLTVEHKKTKTAYFELATRTLVCPIYENMTGDLYDLFVGHEVGHALYTPPEGWHNAVANHKSMGFKGFLNVIEDIRIERKMKELYPGLKKSFYAAYKTLMDRDFFGTETISISVLPLIDRINLSAKCGSLVNIKFSKEEQHYVDLALSVDTWDEVVSVAETIYNYSKEKESFTSLDSLFADFAKKMRKDMDEDDGLDFDDIRDNVFEESDKDDDEEKEEPYSLTDRVFRSKEADLIDKDVVDNFNVYFPKLNMENRIFSYKDVYQEIQEEEIFSKDVMSNKDYIAANRQRFVQKNNKYIGFLIKEFLLKKNAEQLARVKITKTGRLDSSRISRYKFDGDLFLRNVNVPNGKNHGMVMFLDMSASMHDIFANSLEQIIVLATFCKKVGILFDVYGFSEGEHYVQLANKKRKENNITAYNVPPLIDFTSARENSFVCNRSSNYFHLLQLLSSDMKKMEFTNAVDCLLAVKESYANLSSKRRMYDRQEIYFKIPRILNLYGTPLNETIVAGIDIVNKFRQKNNLEKVSTIFVTDGDANEWRSIKQRAKSYGSTPVDEEYKYVSTGPFYCMNEFNYNLIHEESKFSVCFKSRNAKNRENITPNLLSVFKHLTQSNVIGYFLITDARQLGSESIKKCDRVLSLEEKQSFREERFLSLNSLGYDKFFCISMSKEEVEEENEEDFDEKYKNKEKDKSQIRDMFRKKLKKRKVNKMFLTRFAEEIA